MREALARLRQRFGVDVVPKRCIPPGERERAQDPDDEDDGERPGRQWTLFSARHDLFHQLLGIDRLLGIEHRMIRNKRAPIFSGLRGERSHRSPPAPQGLDPGDQAAALSDRFIDRCGVAIEMLPKQPVAQRSDGKAYLLVILGLDGKVALGIQTHRAAA